MRRLLMVSTVLVCGMTSSFAQAPAAQNPPGAQPQQQQPDEGPRTRGDREREGDRERDGDRDRGFRDRDHDGRRDIMEIETGIGATGIAVSITGAMIVILTGLDGASGFASRMKTATSTAGIANRSRSLYVNEMKNPPGLKPGGFHLSSSGCTQR